MYRERERKKERDRECGGSVCIFESFISFDCFSAGDILVVVSLICFKYRIVNVLVVVASVVVGIVVAGIIVEFYCCIN